jgi:NAD(P)-dependent dehydrogenase (short-subunit alcohol dehydrogenase family)
LASVGAKVFFSCRSQTKVDETTTKLRELVTNADVYGFVMEMSSLESVKACAEQFLQSGQNLNVLINNAGVMACPLQQTKEGFETQVSTTLSTFNTFALTQDKFPFSSASII